MTLRGLVIVMRFKKEDEMSCNESRKCFVDIGEVLLSLQRKKAIGAWCSWLAFLHGVQAVARSSRAAPTICQ